MPTARTGRIASYASERAQAVQVIRNWVIYYETHPNAPIPERVDINCYVLVGTDEENFAEVDRIAAVLGVEARWTSGYYVARREFGPMVAYEAAAIPAAALAAYPAVPGAEDAA